jgi:16S rRNA (adenine1518-N6/adenine1519-N6)-dimethyltransferase
MTFIGLFMNIDQLKNYLRTKGLKPNFNYGQNFLIDEFVLEDIVDAAEVSKEDSVLEIGPGIANLTEKLLERAKTVLSIEKDPKFLPVLKSLKKHYKNFRYEIADVLEYNFQKFFEEQGNKSYKVVANIPYYITGKILQMLMTAKFKPSSITVLTQKEVAQNVVAKPGNMSILAISVQLFGDPQLVQIVQAKSFYPAPKVDSAILKVEIPQKAKYKISDEKEFFRVVKACFSGKRKQIHNTLMNNLKLEKSKVEEILQVLKINPAARPQELYIEDWIKLSELISQYQQVSTNI